LAPCCDEQDSLGVLSHRRLLPTAFAAAALAAGAGAAPPPLAQAKAHGKTTRQVIARAGKAPKIPVRPAVRGR
jgi:hypothetical protein